MYPYMGLQQKVELCGLFFRGVKLATENLKCQFTAELVGKGARNV